VVISEGEKVVVEEMLVREQAGAALEGTGGGLEQMAARRCRHVCDVTDVLYVA